MPVSPLPFFRSRRDDEARSGRGGPAGGTRTGLTRVGESNADVAAVPVGLQAGDVPVLLVDDGRTALTILNETREQAEQLGGRLEQLETAADGAATVQKLLGRLRNAVVLGARRDLEPARRAVLQRGIDQTLVEIDALAEGTVFEQELPRAGVCGTTRRGSGSGPTPFKQIGTSALGLSDLAVRSSDQAVAAAGALDIATSRLGRVTGSIQRAVRRFEDDLAGLTSPPVTATGELALGNTTAAFGSTIQLRSDLLANTGEAVRAQTDLEVSRVIRLLASSEP